MRELAFAARQYAVATATNPGDYDALYNNGLVLQELSGRLPAGSSEQAGMLRQVREGCGVDRACCDEAVNHPFETCALLATLDMLDMPPPCCKTQPLTVVVRCPVVLWLYYAMCRRVSATSPR